MSSLLDNVGMIESESENDNFGSLKNFVNNNPKINSGQNQVIEEWKTNIRSQIERELYGMVTFNASFLKDKYGTEINSWYDTFFKETFENLQQVYIDQVLGLNLENQKE